MPPSQYLFRTAIHDFQSARQKVGLQEVLARISGKSNRLLSYNDVAEKLRLHARTERGIRTIPLDAIVGSVGRYAEFTRTFLPRQADDQERWARVKAAFMDPESTLPPIEVYQVGEVYFVIDGNHRVSVARQEGLLYIEARVIEVMTGIPLTPDVQPDDLIIKAEYAEFLGVTRIMDLRPNVDLSVTIPNQYGKLVEQIRIEGCLPEEGGEGSILSRKAVEDWYDNNYTPLAEAIRDRGLLRWFPGRTITDLYVWIVDNRSALEKELGWEIQSDITATDLILERSLQSEPGSWRKARTISRYTENLFADILVPLSGDAECWDALEQAIRISKREGARIHGLHIVGSKEGVESPDALAVQAQFNQRCTDAKTEGNLIIEAGAITKKICERAAMTDLVVLKIAHPPMGGFATLKSWFRTIIMNSSRPVLGVPSRAAAFRRALFAYDGSPRAREALFVAAYMAEAWKTELIIFSALESGKIRGDIQDHARRYLEIHEVHAEYILSEEDAMLSLRNMVEKYQADLVLMGGYGGSVLREMVIGSALDYMLRESEVPMFICH